MTRVSIPRSSGCPSVPPRWNAPSTAAATRSRAGLPRHGRPGRYSSSRSTRRVDLGDSVLWLGRAQLKGGASNLELDQEFAVRIAIDGGKIVHIKGFRTWDEALEAAGL